MENILILGGLILNFIGSLILVLVTLFGKWHQKIYTNHWTKRYWWEGWRPIIRIKPQNKKSCWRIKLNHYTPTYGFIPPKHLWNSVGFLIISVGFLLQILNLIK